MGSRIPVSFELRATAFACLGLTLLTFLPFPHVALCPARILATDERCHCHLPSRTSCLAQRKGPRPHYARRRLTASSLARGHDLIARDGTSTVVLVASPQVTENLTMFLSPSYPYVVCCELLTSRALPVLLCGRYKGLS
jgi:hypothetical protein